MDRQCIKDEFRNYIEKYDLEDPKIRLKAEHTYRVAALCERIAKDIASEFELTESDTDLAWIIGMLHDIGRFEQVRIFGTFFDADSVDHAQFGADILFQNMTEISHQIHEDITEKKGHSTVRVDMESDDSQKCENEKVISSKVIFEHNDKQKKALEVIKSNMPEGHIVELAIRNHNRLKVESDLTDRELLFANIIRDADKIDILKVNSDFRVEDIYNVTTPELLEADISDVVLKSALEGHAVDRKLKMTCMDSVVAHASMMQELNFAISKRIVREQGYLKQLLNRDSNNKDTLRKLEILREHMSELIG